MNGSDLLKLRKNEIDFESFSKKHREYFKSMSAYFHRRARAIRCHVDREDMQQIGLLELWSAVADYKWRCQKCASQFDSDVAFASHQIDAHGAKGDPRPTMFKYVHGRVGRALEHEIRRHTRRGKFQGEMPETWEPSVDAQQEVAAKLNQLLEKAQVDLNDLRQQILGRMLSELPLTTAGLSYAKSEELRKKIETWARDIAA